MARDVNVIATIREDGTLVVLDNEASHCFRDGASVRTQRASHVEPDNMVCRLVFHVLRLVFGDKGWMAKFTRYWPCLWRVNISPIGGDILAGRWRDRQAAIDAEVEWLNENLS